MKKLMVIMTVMMAAVTAVAQDADPDPEGGFRIQGGIGINTLYFKDNEDNFENLRNKIKVGGFGGIGYEKRFGSVFALQPELNYANKGAKREFYIPLTNEDVRMKLSLHTLEIPVLAKFYLGDNFNMYVGPYIGFLVGAKMKSKFYNAATDNQTGDDQSVNIMADKYEDADGNSYFNRFDVGLNAGLEFVTNKGFFLGARINQGFMDLTNDDYKGYVGQDAVIFTGDNKWVGNTGVQVMAGFRF